MSCFIFINQIYDSFVFAVINDFFGSVLLKIMSYYFRLELILT